MFRAAGGNENFTAPVDGNLQDDVRGRAEPVKAELLFWSDIAQPQRAVADDPSAKQRRCMRIVETFRDTDGKRGRGDRMLCITTVDVKTSELCLLAKILMATSAKLASTAASMQPRNADPVAVPKFADGTPNFLNHADDLVTGHNRQFACDFAFDGVEIGMTNSAGSNANKDFVAGGFGHR
jgi:hypothetical protein